MSKRGNRRRSRLTVTDEQTRYRRFMKNAYLTTAYRLFAYSPLPQKINKVSIQKYRKTDNFKPPIYCILQHPLQFKMISAINLIFSARYRWKSRIICPQKERCYVKYYIFRKRKPVSVKLFAKQVSCHL